MRYLTLSPLLRLRLENTNNIICILGGQHHHEYIGKRVHTLGVYGTAFLPVLSCIIMQRKHSVSNFNDCF